MAIIRDGYIGSGLIAGDNYSASTYIYSGTSTTFTIPENVASMTFEAWGGGGGGRGGSSSGPQTDSFPGGGGGAYARTTIYSPAPGNMSLVVGAAGIANGASGGNTSVISGATTFCLAEGGETPPSAGSGGLGGRVNFSSGDTKYAGGNGAGGCVSCISPAGGGRGGGAAGSTGGAAGGTGASEFGGNGGNGGAHASGPPFSTNGSVGNAYGAGGGGGCSYDATPCLGANGAKGLIRITYQILLT